jgi:hypothetical protein
MPVHRAAMISFLVLTCPKLAAADRQPGRGSRLGGDAGELGATGLRGGHDRPATLPMNRRGNAGQGAHV